MGKSRSTTLIIAYLLSTASMPVIPSTVLASIRICRPIAEPNDGFMSQLDLYHRMGCPKDLASQPLYQRWLYHREVAASVACGKAPDMICFGDEYSTDDAASADAGANSQVSSQGERDYRCRRCRRSLGTSSSLIVHTPKSEPLRKTSEPISSFPSSASSLQCAHLFLEPLSWMRLELEQGKLEGRLECPNEKCKTNVGKYAWQGMRCSCGEWIVPGISLARSRVDEIKSRPAPVAGGLRGGKI